MCRRAFLITLAIASTWPVAGWATLIVDPARPITHRVTVQIIETALTNGASPATIFGDAGQRANIEAGIDAVWAQAGIDIDFSPPVVRYNNTFAYQGNSLSTQTRPSSDLGTIINNAGSTGGILNPSAAVINMFFVNVVPAFAFTSENTANGIGNFGRNGIAAFSGDNLLGFQNGLDVIAGVMAHEIGHNLGLNHTPNGTANLMSPGGTSQQLSAAQIAAVFQTTFRNDAVAFIPAGGTGFQPFTAIVAGDYNRDGIVNAADFSLWRNTLGSTSNLAADGNGNSIIDSGDYTLWQRNFGRTAAAGTGSEPSQLASTTVTEPVSGTTLLIGISLLVVFRVAGISHRSQ